MKKREDCIVKKEYFPPRIDVELIETEQCIAGSSATLQSGVLENPDTPVITDWTNNDINGNTDFDF